MRVQELEQITTETKPNRLPRWVGGAGLAVAAGVFFIGLGLFSGEIETNPTAAETTLAPTTTTTSVPPVPFPSVMVAGVDGVSVDGEVIHIPCAELAADDMAGGFVVQECGGGVFHFDETGERRRVASEEFRLHFVDELTIRGFAAAVAFRRGEGSVDVVAYDVHESRTETGSLPAIDWWAVSPGVQAVVGYDIENEQPAVGCMEVRRGSAPGLTTLVGCAEGEPGVIAAALDPAGERVAYAAVNATGAIVLSVLDLVSDEVEASVRIEADPIWMDFDGRFVAVSTWAGEGLTESFVIDSETYAKQEYAGQVSFVRVPPRTGG